MITFSSGKYDKTLVYRSLIDLVSGIEDEIHSSNICIVHAGFNRPKIRVAENIVSSWTSTLILTSSAKWAMPNGSDIKVAPIGHLHINAENQPCYQVLEGLGQHSDLTESVAVPTASDLNQYSNDISNENALLSAACAVLEKQRRPLNKEEIFAHIVQDELYQFNIKRPLDALDRVLMSKLENWENDGSAEVTFGKNKEGRFVYLGEQTVDVSDWLISIKKASPELIRELLALNIKDEKSYLVNYESLETDILKAADAYRYRELKQKTDLSIPHELLSIIPNDLLAQPIEAFHFPVRVENVLLKQGFKSPRDVKPFQEPDMLKWTAFGQKSIKDFCSRLVEVADRFVNETLHSEIQLNECKSEMRTGPSAKQLSLFESFRKFIENLRDKERIVLEYRTGVFGVVPTLQEVASKIGITRERVRQIQKKKVEDAIKVELWPDKLTSKIGQLLASREEPLILEMLELEDDWFKGFIDNYSNLSAIIELFSDGKIQIVKANGLNIIARLKQEQWDELTAYMRKTLPDRAEEKQWTRNDIKLLLHTQLNKVGSPELTDLLFKQFSGHLRFNDPRDKGVLVAFGNTIDSAVATVLEQAESPLHFVEVANRASAIMGKSVDERTTQNCLKSQGAILYGRGIYGLAKFNPFSERESNLICRDVAQIMYEGPLMRQWHSKGILTKLKEKYQKLPDGLNAYILNLILSDEPSITYLNRMVWARADSNQTADARIDMADAFTRILEVNGAPMKGSELREKLSEIRGVDKQLQIQPNDKMIQIGKDLWGLIDRDLGASEDENSKALDILETHLEQSQRGIHLSEVQNIMHQAHIENYSPPYVLFNVAQRDERFHLAKAMFLGLSKWEGDVRRLNSTQAVKRVLADMQTPMTLTEIQSEVEKLTGLKAKSSITNLLSNQKAYFNPQTKKWFRSKQ